MNKIELTREELTKMLQVATGNIKDFVMNNDKFIDEQLKAINFTHCCTELPTLEEIKLKAKQETSFPKMCYPNEIIERNCCAKYKEGAEWMKEQLTN